MSAADGEFYQISESSWLGETPGTVVLNTRQFRVKQESCPYPDRDGYDDQYILIQIIFCKGIGGRTSRDCPCTYPTLIGICARDFWVHLSAFKENPSPFRSQIIELFRTYLSPRNVPLEDFVMQQLAEVVDAAESTDFAIFLEIWEFLTTVPSDIVDTSPRIYRPATRESIGDLERARLDGSQLGEICALCLEDYVDEQQLVVTRLPCSHYFHGDCILRWLNIHHTCPMCRFAMPAQP